MIHRSKTIPALAAFAAVLAFALGADAQDTAGDPTLRLKIGDPRFKDKTLDIAPADLVSAETGKSLPFAKMIEEMKAARIVHVGETHNSKPVHDLQAKIIRALYEQDRNLIIGMEMFPSTMQDVLNKWSLGILSEEEFIREARWYVTWNFHFAFYRDVFEFAKENRIPIYGLNAPREIITKIRMSGWDALADAEKTLVPKPELTHAEHRQLMKQIFGSAEMPGAMAGMPGGADMMFEGLYRAQSAWDEVMSANAVEAVQRERKRMVVLVGSGHLIYNLGLNRRAYEKSKLPFKTVISVFVEKDKPAATVARSLGDYLFGIAEEERPAYPSIGISLKKIKNLENPVIDAKPIDGVALGQDIEKGDILLTVDGKSWSDVNELRTYWAALPWDGETKLHVLRAGGEKDVVLKIKITPRPAMPPAKK
jgi:uncharacterized iron-regulated protein